MMMDQAKFAPCVDEQFNVLLGGTRLATIELVAVTDRSSAEIEAFSLMFRGPHHPVLSHETFRVQHSALGEFALFMGPVSVRQTDGIYYEAVFNRPRM